MTTLQARILRSEDSLNGIEDAWWDLWRRTPAATPFQAPGWLLPWWRVFHPGALCTIAVHDRERLVALAPLYCEHGTQGRRLLPLGISLSDYHDVLVDPACSEAAELLLGTATDAIDWDICSFEELAPGAAALALSSDIRLRDTIQPQSACPALHLPEALSHLSEVVPARKLRKWRMARNRAARRNGYRIERVAPADAQIFLDELFRLHGARWERRGEAGLLREDRVRLFHRATAPALLAAGLARFVLMHLEGQVVGAYYGFCHGRKAFAYLGGFDPAFAFESPGTVLIGHAIESAVAEGCREFHFLRGQEPYKYEWGAVDRWSMRRTLVREVAHV